MLADVSSQLSGVHGLNALGLCKSFAINLCIAVVVLFQLIKNLCHNCVCNLLFDLKFVRPTTPGETAPAASNLIVVTHLGDIRNKFARLS